MNNSIQKFIAIAMFTFILPIVSFARAGGGGSSGGGGGGGGSSFSGGSNFDSGSTGTGVSVPCTGTGCWLPGLLMGLFQIIFIGFFIFLFIFIFKKAKEAKLAALAKTAKEIEIAGTKDSTWNSDRMVGLAKGIFLEFQKGWSDMNTETLKIILEPEMYKRIALELSVLNNEKRRNSMQNIQIIDAYIIGILDDADNRRDSFSVSFTARADDKLTEMDTQKVLFSDTSTFTEIWDFIRAGGSWQLKAIHQATEDVNNLIPEISNFASKNNFFYNPDFGWLMLPNKGILFKESKFGTTDINNHVVGYFREKIVEFYTMSILGEGDVKDNYLVAQAILPINYNDIIIRRKKLFQFDPSGMREHSLESNEFNKEFEVFSDERDNIETFELLTPNFMEKIMKLPFELNIEVVGNTLYLSTKDTDVDYDKMLEILSYAFDEMKM